jgi:hypothetical protein
LLADIDTQRTSQAQGGGLPPLSMKALADEAITQYSKEQQNKEETPTK